MSPYRSECGAPCRIALLLLLSIACGVGCQSTGYRAGELPQKYRANATRVNQDLNLAQFASPGASNSALAAGDLLEVIVATGRDDEEADPALVRVANDGTVDVPVVGAVPVVGLDEYNAADIITSEAIRRGMYRHPVVTVKIVSKAVNRITVLGAVQQPGVHEIPKGGCDLVAALAAAGGLNEAAGTEVEIIRQPGLAGPVLSAASRQEDASDPDGVRQVAYQEAVLAAPFPGGDQGGLPQDPQVLRFDLAELNQATGVETKLSDRDIVRVISRKKEMIYVAGLVNKPGQFEIPPDQNVHLIDAIALAGGRSSPVADKILVLRRVPESEEPLMIRASMGRAKKSGQENLMLVAGDTVTVEQTPATAAVDLLYKFFRISFGYTGRTFF